MSQLSQARGQAEKAQGGQQVARLLHDASGRWVDLGEKKSANWHGKHESGKRMSHFGEDSSCSFIH